MRALILKKAAYATLLGFILTQSSITQSCDNPPKYVGVFNLEDPQIEGIIFGNWGSRQYEYAWASTVVDIKDKRVIDLGIGLPSEFTWYKYVIHNLQPAFYAGIDCDGRMIAQQVKGENYELKFMSATQLKYSDKSFDVAYSIGTFQLMSLDMVMKSVAQIHRVLKDDGLLVMTLDEAWDMDIELCHANSWNFLESDVIKKGLFERTNRPFGLPEFLTLIQDYFELFEQDAILDINAGNITANHCVYYDRKNRDLTILNSGQHYNSCVSYAVLKKKKIN